MITNHEEGVMVNDIEPEKVLYPHQVTESIKAVQVLSEFGICMLCFQVRTGKTGTALNAAKLYGACNVLFLTKKKAIGSIEGDYRDMGFLFNIMVTNYENLHNVTGDFDFYICDESHKCFVAGSKVDGKNIEDINLGESLNTFNFDLNIIERKKVLAINKNLAPKKLIKIKINGRVTTCTEDHLFYTKRGYIPAKSLTTEDFVFTM